MSMAGIHMGLFMSAQDGGSHKGRDFLDNTGFTRADLIGCSVLGQATHVCKSCWAKSETAKKYWTEVVLPFKTFDPEARAERSSRHKLSDANVVIASSFVRVTDTRILRAFSRRARRTTQRTLRL